MDSHFQIKTPLDLLELRTVGFNDTTYGVNVWNPTHASYLEQGEWLAPTATYRVMDRIQLPATKLDIATYGSLFYPVLDLRGSYDQQAQPWNVGGTHLGGCSVIWAGSTFEVYTDRISTAATAAGMTIGTAVALETDTLNIAGGGGAGSARLYVSDVATLGTDVCVGYVIQPYSAVTGYVGFIAHTGSAY